MKFHAARPPDYGRWFGFCLQRTVRGGKPQFTFSLWYWLVGFYF
jgi:hypothetical protein